MLAFFCTFNDQAGFSYPPSVLETRLNEYFMDSNVVSDRLNYLSDSLIDLMETISVSFLVWPGQFDFKARMLWGFSFNYYYF